MHLGIHYSNFTHPDWQQRLTERLTETARVADQGGVAQLTVMDHWFQMEMLGGPDEPMLEAYTALGYLAGVTERIRLGVLVTGITYRHPGLLAKIATTLDVLSEGRTIVGVGAAWYDREHEGLGVPFPSTKERFERLEETLQILQQMFAGDRSAYDGTHYRLTDPANVPLPRQSPPPIMVGGSGERKTLRMVAQYADACNLFAGEVDEVAHKLDVLRGHCDRLGTDYDAIEKTIIARADPTQDADGFLRDMAAYAGLGVTMVCLSPPTDDPVAWTTAMVGDVVPRLSEV